MLMSCSFIFTEIISGTKHVYNLSVKDPSSTQIQIHYYTKQCSLMLNTYINEPLWLYQGLMSCSLILTEVISGMEHGYNLSIKDPSATQIQLNCCIEK